MINNPNRHLVSGRAVMTIVALLALAISLLAYGWRDAGALDAPTKSTKREQQMAGN